VSALFSAKRFLSLTKLMNVEAVKTLSESSDITKDSDRLSWFLRKLDGAVNTGVLVFLQNADCEECSIRVS